MQKIDRTKFFDGYRAAFGPLVQQQVDGLNALLSSMEADSRIEDLRWAAYMLATVKRECGNTFQPIKEYGRGRGMKYGTPDGTTGQTYYGRGYVQLTWKDNYRAMGDVLGLDLVRAPDLALDPAVAYRIMSYGMRQGAFTGVGLPRYINSDKCDYVNARKIINGLDCAEMIAGYASTFESLLTT